MWKCVKIPHTSKSAIGNIEKKAWKSLIHWNRDAINYYFHTFASFLFEKIIVFYYSLHANWKKNIYTSDLNTGMSTFNLSLHLRGNISNNVSERISFFYFQFFLFVGIFIAVENIISIVILFKSTHQNFVIKLGDFWFVYCQWIVLNPDKWDITWKCQMWYQKVSDFYVYQRISVDHYYDEPGLLFRFCFCNAILFVHH